MKEIVQKWLNFAESDFDAADYLFGKPRANQWTFILVVWHCHQAIEKILKAIIIHHDKEILRNHDLPLITKNKAEEVLIKTKDLFLCLTKNLN